MKKLTLIVLALAIIALRGYSQEQVNYPKNQISVSYGSVSFISFLEMLPNDEATKNRGGYIEKNDYHKKTRRYRGIYNVQYMRAIKPKLEIGLAANYERIDRLFNYENPKKISRIKTDRIYRVLCVGQFNIINKEYARAYAKGGVGVLYEFLHYPDGTLDDETSILPCIEGLAGIEYGPRLLRPFIEVGYGAQGIVTFGLRTRF